VILTYLNKGPIMMDSKLMHETLRDLVPEREEQIHGLVFTTLLREGHRRGCGQG
jgi:hypothetical protein